MDEPLYVVDVEDQRDERLAGQAGCAYHSPAHTADQARALVRILLGGARTPDRLESGEWRLPVAGGQRIIRTRRLRDGSGQ